MNSEYNPLNFCGGTIPHFTRTEYKTYGYREPWKGFTTIPKSEFFEVLKEGASHSLFPYLEIRKTSVENKRLVSISPLSLTVFNSSSYALPHLVNIFSLQTQLNRIEQFVRSFNFTVKEIKLIMKHVRLGVNVVTLIKRILFDPSLLTSRLAYLEIPSEDVIFAKGHTTDSFKGLKDWDLDR